MNAFSFISAGFWTETLSSDCLPDESHLWICFGYDLNMHYFINSTYCGRLFVHHSDKSKLISNDSSSPQYLSIADYFNARKSTLPNPSSKAGSSVPKLWLLFDLFGNVTGIDLMATADDVNCPSSVMAGGQDSMVAYALACQNSGVTPETDVPFVFIGPNDSGKSKVAQSLVTGRHIDIAGSVFGKSNPGGFSENLMRLEGRNFEDMANSSLDVPSADVDQWNGAYLCSTTVEQRPLRRGMSYAFMESEKKPVQDHLLRMSVSSAKNLVLQALAKYDKMNIEPPSSPADKSAPMLDGEIETSGDLKITNYLSPDVVSNVANDLLMLAQEMFDELVTMDESGNGNLIGVANSGYLSAKSHKRLNSSNSIKRVGRINLSYRICDVGGYTPDCFWLSPISMLPKAIYVVTFDLTKIDTSVPIGSIDRSTTSGYLSEISDWFHMLSLKNFAEQGKWSQKDDESSHSHHPLSPSVLLVGTHADQVPGDDFDDTVRAIASKLKFVADWFSDYKQIVAVTAHVNILDIPAQMNQKLDAFSSPTLNSQSSFKVPLICGTNQLRRTLENIAKSQITTKILIPKHWFELDDTLLNLASDGLTFLTTEQLRTLAADSKMSEDAELASYVRYSHAMGRIFYASASNGISVLQDNCVSDGIIFVNPHGLTLAITKAVEHFTAKMRSLGINQANLPLVTEDQLHQCFQQGSTTEDVSKRMDSETEFQNRRRLRWVTWLLNKLDIATPWMSPPDDRELERKFVFLPMIPPRINDHACELPPGTSPMFTFYINFKTQQQMTDFIYILFLCRCLRWLVSRGNQNRNDERRHQQDSRQSSQYYDDDDEEEDDNDEEEEEEESESPRPKTASPSILGRSSNSCVPNHLRHHLSKTVSYLMVEDNENSLVVVITNQIEQLNRIKICVKTIQPRRTANEEPTTHWNAKDGHISDDDRSKTKRESFAATENKKQHMNLTKSYRLITLPVSV